jgi:hypothetical protein
MSAQMFGQVTSPSNGVDQTTDAIGRESRFGEVAKSWWSRKSDMMRDAAGTVRDEAAAFGNRTRRYVKDEPVKSTLAAVIFGATLTGLLIMIMKHER